MMVFMVRTVLCFEFELLTQQKISDDFRTFIFEFRVFGGTSNEQYAYQIFSSLFFAVADDQSCLHMLTR